MADLQHAGHHFQTVSCELWKVSGPKVRIKKDCSVCFSVDTVVTSQDIVVGFDKSGIDIHSITSIQRKASNNTWIVTFDSPVSKTAALNEQSVTISGCVVFLGDCENKVTIVKLSSYQRNCRTRSLSAACRIMAACFPSDETG